MGKELITFKMEIGIKVIGRMIVCKETEIIILRMVISFQDNGLRINKMVKGYKHFTKEVDMKVILKMGLKKEKGNGFTLIKLNMLGNFVKIASMVKDCINLEMEIHTKAHG